jgi:hypothetical protein
MQLVTGRQLPALAGMTQLVALSSLLVGLV